MACRQKLKDIHVSIVNYIGKNATKKCSNSCSIYEKEFQSLELCCDIDVYCIDETDFFESLIDDILVVTMWEILGNNTTYESGIINIKTPNTFPYYKFSLIANDQIIYTTTDMKIKLCVDWANCLDLSFCKNITINEKLSYINELINMLKKTIEYINVPKKIIC